MILLFQATECDSSRTTSVCENQDDVETRLKDVHLDEQHGKDESSSAGAADSTCPPSSEADAVPEGEVVVRDQVEEASPVVDIGEDSDPGTLHNLFCVNQATRVLELYDTLAVIYQHRVLKPVGN